jgi:hypothetical protein
LPRPCSSYLRLLSSAFSGSARPQGLLHDRAAERRDCCADLPAGLLCRLRPVRCVRDSSSPRGCCLTCCFAVGCAVARNSSVPVSCCAQYRDPASPLCGACLPGYSESGGQCFACTQTRWGYVVLFFLISLGLLEVFHRISQDTTADTKVKLLGLFFGFTHEPLSSFCSFCADRVLLPANEHSVPQFKHGPAAMGAVCQLQ